MKKQKDIPKHLDKLVIYLFGITFLLSATLFAFKYSKYSTCKGVDFDVIADNLIVDQIITFSDNTKGAKSWEWEFDDGTVKFGKEPMHIYKEPGEYKVLLTVNGICEREQIVVIKNKQILIDSTKYPIFSLPTSIVVGETLKVADETDNALSWEWRFEKAGSVISTNKKAEYVYEESGIHTISLIVNGDYGYIKKKQINVLPQRKKEFIISEIESTDDYEAIPSKPDEEFVGIPETPLGSPILTENEVPYINDKNFKAKLYLIQKEKLTANDFIEYFCDGDLNKSIIVNGDSSTFLSFCIKIRGKKGTIKNLIIYRAAESKCINSISIKWKRKLI